MIEVDNCSSPATRQTLIMHFKTHAVKFIDVKSVQVIST